MKKVLLIIGGILFLHQCGYTQAKIDRKSLVERHNVHISKVDKLTGGMEFYLEVSKLDELWESIKTNIAGLHVREPFDRDYGMREFHIGVPYTKALMFVGEDISKRN